MKHLTLNKNIALLSTSLNPYPQTKRWESLIFLFSLSQSKIKFLKKKTKKTKKDCCSYSWSKSTRWHIPASRARKQHGCGCWVKGFSKMKLIFLSPNIKHWAHLKKCSRFSWDTSLLVYWDRITHSFHVPHFSLTPAPASRLNEVSLSQQQPMPF